MTSVLLPDLIANALAANDRIKYYLTLLQTAHAYASEPAVDPADLALVRAASGVTDSELDTVVRASRYVAEGTVRIPRAARLRQLIVDDVKRMIAPTAASDDHADMLTERLERLVAAAPDWADDQIDAASLDLFTGAGDPAHDTVHRLVMDLHRKLNQLVATTATETIDGARAMAIRPEDRGPIAALMKGVNETAGLKFDHPGLGTTAARSAEGLVIQNDLGTTDGHLVVVRIAGLAATITYADIHPLRVRFFETMLGPHAIQWQRGAAPEKSQLETIVGTFTAGTTAELEQFLTFLGSRLVFLIDWNKARKRLGRFLKKADAIGVLLWAAENNVGHRGFLQAGGVPLIATAFERIAPARVHYGARLDELIGAEAAIGILRGVLRLSSEGLRKHHSVRFIQDEIEAELLSHLHSADSRMLETTADHALLLSGLAERIRAALGRGRDRDVREEILRAAALAKTWETRADEIVRNASRSQDRSSGRVLTDLLSRADDVADALEEAVFLLTLLPDPPSAAGLGALSGLADLVAEATREYLRALEHVRDLVPGHSRSELDDLLLSVDRIAEIEHATDTAERAARGRLLSASTDFRELQILSDAARRFEQATDALARCAVTIRDYALNMEALRS